MVRRWLDYGQKHDIMTLELAMEEIAISKFKATCLAVLERVRKTGESILVTRFGHPVAQISPAGAVKKIKLGGGAGTAVILGDIVGPIGDISEWEAAQDRVEVEDKTKKTRKAK
jgi:antitoxin (DNA-binding transcriptional repressor) of toxin-antitoxin stability system